ncbi:MAG: restriction endonuclease subunit S [Helicobacter sp.]|nr:restriction endonuclease subunit S [Helicobacter sp.]
MRAFKDSGIEWLGEIPEHWEVVKIKHIAEIVTGKTPALDSEWGDNMLFITPTDCDLGKKYISSSLRKLSQNGIKNFASLIIPKNSLLVTCIASIGKVVINPKEVVTNQQINSVIPNLGLVSSDFIFYQLLVTMPFAEKYFCGYSILPILNKSEFSNIKIPLPPLEEQKRIADFLDSKCAQIDNFCEKKQKLITLLNEKKQSLINECVTKGLDTNVTLKDSGVEHLGEIPKHWEIKKLKYIVSLQNHKSNNIDFRIGLENIESKTGKYIPTNEIMFEEDGIGFEKGDILFGKLRPYLAKVFLADRNGVCVSEFLVLRTSRADNNFLKFLMLSPSFIDIVDSSTYGTKMPRASWDFIGNLKIPIPPLKEQEQIAQFLDSKISKIDKIIEKTKKQIELIKEYKNTLINQAVCGRIEKTKLTIKLQVE